MNQLARLWKGLITRGVIAVAFGLLAIFFPGLTLEFLVLLFGVYAFFDGLVALFISFKVKSVLLALEGGAGMLVGAYVFFYPAQAFIVFLAMVGAWAILTGILEILVSFEIRKNINDEIWMLFVGVISILFGILVFVNPAVPALALSVLIGIYAILFGLFLIMLGQTLKKLNKRPSKRTSSKRKRK